jgi:hypothetical protein
MAGVPLAINPNALALHLNAGRLGSSHNLITLRTCLVRRQLIFAAMNSGPILHFAVSRQLTASRAIVRI